METMKTTFFMALTALSLYGCKKELSLENGVRPPVPTPVPVIDTTPKREYELKYMINAGLDTMRFDARPGMMVFSASPHPADFNGPSKDFRGKLSDDGKTDIMVVCTTAPDSLAVGPNGYQAFYHQRAQNPQAYFSKKDQGPVGWLIERRPGPVKTDTTGRRMVVMNATNEVILSGRGMTGPKPKDTLYYSGMINENSMVTNRQNGNDTLTKLLFKLPAP
ncbi:MAG: hypothetical protein JWM96_685 [Alphaproteobacteria bacterium]|nr:hypothetical protein [Alphaproteobacteria bacterium]